MTFKRVVWQACTINSVKYSLGVFHGRNNSIQLERRLSAFTNSSQRKGRQQYGSSAFVFAVSLTLSNTRLRTARRTGEQGVLTPHHNAFTLCSTQLLPLSNYPSSR